MTNDISATAKQTSTLGNALRRYTSARVSLGQTGPAIPTHEQLRFQLDHALARDAVHTQLNMNRIATGVTPEGDGLPCTTERGCRQSRAGRPPDLSAPSRPGPQSASRFHTRAAAIFREPSGKTGCRLRNRRRSLRAGGRTPCTSLAGCDDAASQSGAMAFRPSVRCEPGTRSHRG